MPERLAQLARSLPGWERCTVVLSPSEDIALATGGWPRRPRVIVSQGALGQMSEDELGIAGEDAPTMRELFAQGYRGARYSFGYPACPDLEQQVGIAALLDPSRIGVELSETFQWHPEQSTSAIIVHHPEARYFVVK